MSAPEINEVKFKHYGPMSEISVDFMDKMARRMAVSFLKYGKVEDAVPFKINAVESAVQRINAYLATENLEFLLDAANFLMMEWMHPSLENAFFKATDSDESPGRIAKNGSVVFNERNEEIKA